MKRLLIPAILLVVLCASCDGVRIVLPGQQAAAPEVVTPEPQPTSEREVLFFTQPGCPPCEAAKPRVEEMRAQGLKVTEINIREQPGVARQYNIVQTPTFVILENGVEIERTSDIVLVVTILVKILVWILPLLFG